jgi:hypothetical protein
VVVRTLPAPATTTKELARLAASYRSRNLLRCSQFRLRYPLRKPGARIKIPAHQSEPSWESRSSTAVPRVTVFRVLGPYCGRGLVHSTFRRPTPRMAPPGDVVLQLNPGDDSPTRHAGLLVSGTASAGSPRTAALLRRLGGYHFHVLARERFGAASSRSDDKNNSSIRGLNSASIAALA